MKIVAVIPAYNESKTISKVIREIKNEVNTIIVVDDGSADNTAELAKSEGAVVLQHFLNRGQGAALQTGINYAVDLGADVVITFDADDQHNAGDIKKLIEPVILGETDIALGSRFLNSNIPFSKLVTLKLAIVFDKLRTGLNITDTHNGLRAFSKKVAEKIEIKQDGMAHASEILDQISKLKLKYKEVPVTVNYTEYSKEKGQRLSGSFKILWDLLISRLGK